MESSRTRIELGLDRDGSFLDPEKYEPVKLLGSGGFAKVLLLIENKFLQIGTARMHHGHETKAL